MDETEIKIDVAGVKVMRSHDYCHFEVTLSTSGEITPERVDELRKTAARLADKAVKQYTIAKANAYRLMGEKTERQYLVQRVEAARKIPELERTVRQQAEIKAYDDEAYQASREYDYEDQWNQDNEG